MEKRSRKLIKICFLICSLILLTIGFLLGYLYVDRGCMENPLGFGVEKMNDINGDNFMCSCTSQLNPGLAFYFNEDFISPEPFFP